MKNPARWTKGTLPVLAALVLTCVTTLPANASAAMQRGQNQSRSVMGRVVGEHDAPMQRAVVYLKNTKTLAIKTYITDSDGSYHFPALTPNVDYEIYAEREGARSDTKTLSGFDSRKVATITLKIKGK